MTVVAMTGPVRYCMTAVAMTGLLDLTAVAVTGPVLV
jgi:hypothetical protein